MFAILGSGFGLYGYLPALVQEGEGAVLLQRYRERFESRAGLAGLVASVLWARDEWEALDRADGAVLARRPADQMEWAPRCAEARQIRRLILEKPIGPTPEAAMGILRLLIGEKKSFRVGYTFRFTSWGQDLLGSLTSARIGSLSMRWSFMAHHYRRRLNNWKRFNSEGGGALRFYGIQLIALLAELGYSDVVWSRTFGRSRDEIETWTAAFAGLGHPLCEVLIESRSATNEFMVETRTDRGSPTIRYQVSDPFGVSENGTQFDRRVPILARLYRSFSQDSAPWYHLYESVNRLWAEVERKNAFEAIVVGSPTGD